MKSSKNPGKENGSKQMLERVREALRRWYGTLSVRELVNNRALIAEIEMFERMLSRQEVMS